MNFTKKQTSTIPNKIDKEIVALCHILSSYCDTIDNLIKRIEVQRKIILIGIDTKLEDRAKKEFRILQQQLMNTIANYEENLTEYEKLLNTPLEERNTTKYFVNHFSPSYAVIERSVSNLIQ